MMSQAAKMALLEYKPISDRVIVARFCGRPFNITVIQVYASTWEAEDATTEQFYEQIQQCMNQIKSQDTVVCMGDWNAKIGTNRDGWEEVVGKFGLRERNDRGDRLLQFAKLNNLYITNTKFKHKPSRKWTWESPDGNTKNMIDMILVNNRWKSSVNGCRSFPGADISSDHNLVICNFKLYLKKISGRQNIKRKFDMEKLKGNSGAYRMTIENLTANWESDCDVNKALKRVNEIIKEAAEKDIGFMRRRNKPWITSKTLDLADEKRKARLNRHRSNTDKIVYSALARRTKESAKSDEVEWLKEQCSDIQESFDQAKTKKAFDLIKKIKKKYVPRSNCI